MVPPTDTEERVSISCNTFPKGYYWRFRKTYRVIALINNNIKDYVKVYKDFFSKEFCQEVVAELQDNNWETHSFHIPDKNEYVSFEDDLAVSFNHEDKKSLKLNDKIWDAINQYVMKDFKSFGNWFSGWNGYTEVRYNKYVVAQK